MRKARLLVFFLSLTLSSVLQAQSDIIISTPQLEFRDNNIIVVYDIINSGEKTFNVWLDVSDENGKGIEAKSVTGDIGEQVSGGDEKKIFWNLTADNVYVDALLSINVNAEVYVAPEIPEGMSSSTPAPLALSGARRFGLTAQSALFPGWGLSTVKNGPHWIKGLAAYGAAAGSIVYASKASKNYDAYLVTSDVSEGNRLFSLSEKQDMISEISGITAGAIWAIDVVWTIFGSKYESPEKAARRLSLNPSIDPHAGAPVLAFTYTF